jgi:membrane protein DedA with SNARE-associated domain
VKSYLHELIGFVSQHSEIAYAVIFLAALLEAVPILGSLIPGSTVIVALSALVPGGSLNLAPVLAAAVSGAIIGDGLGYWIGRKKQREVLSAWPMSKYPALTARSEALFQRFGAFAVIFARFIPPVRAVVPLTAGVLGMPPWRFFPLNIIAILFWAPAHILPGVLAASVIEKWGGRIEHYGPPLIGGIILAGCLGWALYCWQRHGLKHAKNTK